MKPLFESRYYYRSDNKTDLGFSSSFGKPQKVRRSIEETWLAPNFELIEAVAHTGNGLVDLWEASPIRLDSNKPRADEMIDILFPGNPLLCCGWSRHHFGTRPRAHWYNLDKLQFIVPNPMKSRHGLTQQGQFSGHALENTGPRRFVIIEFDFDAKRSTEKGRLIATLERQGCDVRDLSAALLMHLAEKAPMALVVYSGAKSLHGWFYCSEVSEDKVLRFFRYAVSVGADPANWTRSQFTRMPDGLRENQKRQTVYFLNPKVIK